MKNRVVLVPTVKTPVAPSPGFAKKDLSSYKTDILGLCGYGCLYCSSNWGNYLRTRQAEFHTMTLEQLGIDAYPDTEPSLTFEWENIIEVLDQQLSRKRPGFGRGQTLVFSMLTDGFSPRVVADGRTRKALELLVAKTEFRIRILTKNAIVGRAEWVAFFQAHPGRFVVGLSTGTLDNAWARLIEVGTPPPTSRLAALRALQDAGVPAYGMLCPVFPDVVAGGSLDRLLDEVRPERVETLWAEPYNDRANWKEVRRGYAAGSPGYVFLTEAYAGRDRTLWSKYAADLYLGLRRRAERDGWLPKLRYLLYESKITESDAERLGDMAGILFQSKPAADGRSQNPYIAARQGMRRAVR